MADIWGDGLVLPVHTLASGADGSEVTLPPFAIVAGMDGVSSSLPAYTITATGAWLDFVVGDLPVYILDSAMLSGAAVTLDVSLAAHELTGEILPGELFDTGTLEFPGYTMLADFGWAAANDLPAYELEGISALGTVMYGDVEFPVYTITATATGANLLTAANDLPAYLVSASGISGGVGEAALLIPVHRLEALGFSGALLSAANDLPAYVMVAAGTTPYTLVAANTLPAYQLDSAMSAAVAAAFATWVLNLRKRALTEYTNWSFNSFATFGGGLYAAGPNGVYQLGDYDEDREVGGAAVDIPFVVRTGKHNFDTSYAKRVPRIYLGAAADGPLEFRTITGADGARAYLLPHNQSDEVQLRRVPVGRGPKATYWQFEVRNREGANVDVDMLQLYPELSKRRVSGQ
jgi:hypothetical protein